MQSQKKCKCGNSLGDPMIIPKTRYNKKGYFWLSMGYSAKPIEVIFQCQNCGEILDSSTDEETIEKYRYNSDISQ
ncbi:MAG TPA: hypothetical protein VG961_04295 [Ignavibacteria bacterium]|nr:hypothetical protein [Ignavibacteria bacterium]